MKHPALTQVDFTLTHKFNASRRRVFNAFSSAKALAEWWGPVECKNTVLAFDFSEGGVFHYQMEMPDQVNYAMLTFLKIKKYDHLEFEISFSNVNKEVVRAPFDSRFPERVHYRLDFKEVNGKTTIHLQATGVNATEDETRFLKSMAESMEAGFGASFRKLEGYLEARPFL